MTGELVDGGPIEGSDCVVIVGGTQEGEINSNAKDESISARSIIFHDNYPNPFNPRTTIRFSLAVEQHVRIVIYNIPGQNVRTLELGTIAAGVREVLWDGADNYGHRSGSGLCFYRIITPDFTDSKKMLLLKEVPSLGLLDKEQVCVSCVAEVLSAGATSSESE